MTQFMPGAELTGMGPRPAAKEVIKKRTHGPPPPRPVFGHRGTSNAATETDRFPVP